MSTMTLEELKWAIADTETRLQAAADAALAREIHVRELAALIAEEISKLVSKADEVEELAEAC